MSYEPVRQQKGDKDHIAQVPPKKLYRNFSKVRDLCEVTGKPGKLPPTFDEIKGLYINIGLQHHTKDQVEKVAAYMDKSTTMAYPVQHNPVF